MRINLNGPSTHEVVNDQQTAQVGGKRSSDARRSGLDDKTTISADTVTISSLAQTALASPEIREDKVESLRQALNNGQYKLEPGPIADAILKDSGK